MGARRDQAVRRLRRAGADLYCYAFCLGVKDSSQRVQIWENSKGALNESQHMRAPKWSEQRSLVKRVANETLEGNAYDRGWDVQLFVKGLFKAPARASLLAAVLAAGVSIFVLVVIGASAALFAGVAAWLLVVAVRSVVLVGREIQTSSHIAADRSLTVAADRRLTPANVITVLRFLPCGLLVPFLAASGQHVWALVLFAIASAADAVDGYVADEFDQVTFTGKVLDTTSDRLVGLAAATGLIVSKADVPIWLFVAGAAVAMADLSALLIGGWKLRERLFPPHNNAAHRYSIISMFSLGSAYLAVAIESDNPPIALTMAATALAVWALIERGNSARQYARDFRTGHVYVEGRAPHDGIGPSDIDTALSILSPPQYFGSLRTLLVQVCQAEDCAPMPAIAAAMAAATRDLSVARRRNDWRWIRDLEERLAQLVDLQSELWSRPGE